MSYQIETATTRIKTVTIVAYLIGANERFFSYYDKEVLDNIQKHREANIIRLLCLIRNYMITKYSEAKRLYDEFVPLEETAYFGEVYIKLRDKYNIDVKTYNLPPLATIKKINNLIEQHIDGVKELFPTAINWQYISDLFKMPASKTTNEKVFKSKIIQSFITNINKYPYGRYINWQPKSCGNLLQTDLKFLKIIYSQNNRILTTNAALDILDTFPNQKKISIHDFIKEADKVVFAVDCENSNCYFLYSLLKSLSKTDAEKISEIVLYNDTNTTTAWEYLEEIIDVPVTIVSCDRVIGKKSLVDMKMCADVSKLHYSKNINNFVLLTSDSDFYGLISTVETANYYMLLERSKTSNRTIEALRSNDIQYDYLDEYATQEEDLKKIIIKEEINEELKKAKVNAEKIIYIVGNRLKAMKEDERESLSEQIYDYTFRFDRESGELIVSDERSA